MVVQAEGEPWDLLVTALFGWWAMPYGAGLGALAMNGGAGRGRTLGSSCKSVVGSGPCPSGILLRLGKGALLGHAHVKRGNDRRRP